MIELVNLQSDCQHLRLTWDSESGLTLALDGVTQFVESTEYRFHECLAVVPLLFIPKIQSVFVGGGGDGLVATRLLQFDEVKRVVVCDYDSAVTDLAREQGELVNLNKGSMRDPRVEVVNMDAVTYLEKTDDKFDLVVCDFPDPLTEELGKLYSHEFYQLVYKRLTDSGALCIQTMMLPSTAALILNTVRQVFPNVRLFKTPYLEGGWSAFTLGFRNHGSDWPSERYRMVPDWTRYLNEDVVDKLFVLARDEIFHTDNINTLKNSLLVQLTACRVFNRLLTTPCKYNEQHRVVSLDAIHDLRLAKNPTGDLFLSFFKQAGKEQPTIVHVSRDLLDHYSELLRENHFSCNRSYTRLDYSINQKNLQLLKAWREQLGDNVTVEAYAGSAREHSEVASILESFFDKYSKCYFDLDERGQVMELIQLYLLVRNNSGDPIGIGILEPDDELLVELFYCKASGPEKLLAVVSLLLYIGSKYGSELQIRSVDESLTRILSSLQAEQIGVVNVFTNK